MFYKQIESRMTNQKNTLTTEKSVNSDISLSARNQQKEDHYQIRAPLETLETNENQDKDAAIVVSPSEPPGTIRAEIEIRSSSSRRNSEAKRSQSVATS